LAELPLAHACARTHAVDGGATVPEVEETLGHGSSAIHLHARLGSLRTPVLA